MNPKTLSLLSLFAGASVALPNAKRQLADYDAFTLMALRSGSAIHFAEFNAAKGSILLDLPASNASCDGATTPSYATFYIKDGGLYLYSTSLPPQQLYSDRSGMGQGVFQYTTGVEPIARNGQQTNFTLDASNDLTFNGAGFIACPNSIEGSWSVWVSSGVDQPGGNSGCVDFSARAVEATNPVSCSYTE